MIKAMKVKQLSFSLPSRIGLLYEVSSLLTTANVNIEGICAYAMQDQGYFMFITDNQAKAKKIIMHMGAEVKSEDVIMVIMPNKVGELQKAAKKISDAGIDISYIYGSPNKGKMAIVLKTANDRKALKVLNA